MVAHCCEKDDDFLLVVARSGAEFPVFAHDDGGGVRDVGVCGEELISENEGGLGHELIYGLDLELVGVGTPRLVSDKWGSRIAETK